MHLVRSMAFISLHLSLLAFALTSFLLLEVLLDGDVQYLVGFIWFLLWFVTLLSFEHMFLINNLLLPYTLVVLLALLRSNYLGSFSWPSYTISSNL